MLEPLVLLTVLNCLFMFSSTMTTCALWWQYRDRRSHFSRDPSKKLKTTKSNCGHCYSCLKSGQTVEPSKTDVLKNDQQDHKKLNDTHSDHEKNENKNNSRFKCSKDKKQRKKKPKSCQDIKTSQISEGCQTPNISKPTFMVEYSQKVVEIIDNKSEMPTPKFEVKDLISRKDLIQRQNSITNLK